MFQESERRARNPAREWVETQRYRILERLYVVTDAEPGGAVGMRRLADDLGLAVSACRAAVQDLARLGFVEPDDAGSTVHLTRCGKEYIQRGAWRRRSIRD